MTVVGNACVFRRRGGRLMAYGKTIELFLVNGTADSLVTAELSNWNGKAIKIPRIEVASCVRNDLKQTGVYFLFCKDDDGEDAVYIGEAENVKDRLVQHINDYQQDKEKYYWSTAVVFTGTDLNKALIRYLENRLVGIARDAKRYRVLTQKTYKTKLKESQVAMMEEFLDNIRVIINALGYKVLEHVRQGTNEDQLETRQVYSFSIGGASAQGVVTPEGFVLLQGAKINEKTSEKSLGSGAARLRLRLISDTDKVKDCTTIEDILFSSSSAASNFVLGYSVSGPMTWKLPDGRCLRDIEKAQAENSSNQQHAGG